jgi:quercetin dioxygenase-like cupin family protein
MTGFRPFFNPATGEWIEFTAVAEDSDRQLVRFSWRSVAGGVIAEHVHPRHEERFIITSGEARFTLDGEELTARAGDTIVVPAGMPHSEGNPGQAEIRAVVKLRPALRPVVTVYMLPFAAAMVLLAAWIWQAAALPASQPQPEPTAVPV